MSDEEFMSGSESEGDALMEDEVNSQDGSSEEDQEKDFGLDNTVTVTKKVWLGVGGGGEDGRGGCFACYDLQQGHVFSPCCLIPCLPLLSTLPPPNQPAYKVLKGETLEERRRQALEGVTGVLGVNDEEAARLLRRFKWCVLGILNAECTHDAGQANVWAKISSRHRVSHTDTQL